MIIKLLVDKLIGGNQYYTNDIVTVTDPYGISLINKLEAILYSDNTNSDGKTLYTGTINTTGAGTSIDTSGYGSVVAQFSGVWSGVVICELSNDNITWTSGTFYSSGDVSIQDRVETNGVFNIQTSARYVRANITSITGTLNITITGRITQGPRAADMLSLAMDKTNNTPLQVQLPKDLKQEADGGLLIADMKGPFILQSSTASQPLVIDCTGYQSVICHKITAGVITPTISNDGINYYATLIKNTVDILPAAATMPAATGVYATPVQARYIKLTGPASAVTCIVYLSRAPYNLQLPLNIAGTNAIAGGIAGSLAVGGNVGIGVAPTANPITIAGTDSLKIPLIRRILTDELGRIQIGTQNLQNSRQINPLGYDPTYLNVLAVQDITRNKGKSVLDLLEEVILELKVLNYQISELPKLIDEGAASTDNLDEIRKAYEN